MSKHSPKLHLDADASSKALFNALQDKGIDVTRTPNNWVGSDTSDEQQLMKATSQGRVIFTFNIRDFYSLAHQSPHHAGILLAAQSRFTFRELSDLIEKALTPATASEWLGQVRWLSDWRR